MNSNFNMFYIFIETDLFYNNIDKQTKTKQNQLVVLKFKFRCFMSLFPQLC